MSSPSSGFYPPLSAKQLWLHVTPTAPRPFRVPSALRAHIRATLRRLYCKIVEDRSLSLSFPFFFLAPAQKARNYSDPQLGSMSTEMTEDCAFSSAHHVGRH